MKINDKFQGNILLLLTAAIWGSSFVSQRLGMNIVEPFTFNSIRTIVGGLMLLPCIVFLDKIKGDEKRAKENYKIEDLLKGGIVCGAVLFIASSLQQIGLKYTSAGKTGFITALYIVLVPLLGMFFGKKSRWIIWGAVVIAVAGLYMLCIKDGFPIATGDLFVLACAFFFAVHILVIDHFSRKADGVRMSCVQFFTSGIIGMIFMFIFENPKLSEIISCILPILYAGVFSCGIGYTLQIVAQKKTDPTVASLIMSLESVFAVLFGWLLLGELLSGREFWGCILMFLAVILAQIPEKSDKTL